MDRRTIILASISITVLVFAAFGRSLWQGFAPIDDAFLIVQNLAVRGITPASVRLAFTTYDPELYIPLTLASFQVNYLIAGLDPFGYHLTNLLLHAGNAVLVLLLFWQLTNRRWVALLGGLIFAVHPLHTEAVVWIAARKDLLSTFFFLGSLLLYLRYRRGQRWAYALSVALFALALLSKVMAATLPGILLLLDFVQQRRWERSLLRDKIPYLLISVVFLGVAMMGKERILAQSSLLETILLTGTSTLFYLQKLVLPIGLSPFYPLSGPIRLGDPRLIVSLLALVPLCTLTIWSLRRTRWILMGGGFFLLTLMPTFFSFRKGEWIFFAMDHYAYLPSIGIILMICIALDALGSHIRSFQEGKMILLGGITAVLGVFIILSRLQTAFWDSAETLFGHTLVLYPHAVIARTGLADWYREHGRYQDAFELLKDGLRYGDDPALHIGAAYVYASTGDVPSAEEQLRTAAVMAPENPVPLFTLGSLAEQRGDAATAQKLYEDAVALDPSYVAARVGLARVYRQQGSPDLAREQLLEALRWNPSAEEARKMLEREEP